MQRMNRKPMDRQPIMILVALLVLALPAAAQEYGIQVKNLGDGISWNTNFEYGSATLVLTGPKKYTARYEIGSDEVTWRAEGPDGRYTWEVRYLSPISPELAKDLVAARAKGNEEFSCELVDQGVIQSPTFSGSFVQIRGELILPEESGEEPQKARAEKPAGDAVASALGGARAPTKDFVINDDLIVDGSACIGFDCVNGEVFSFDTIRLKENNLRIKFDDTSTAASFPRNDWQLTANDSANGGASKFSIEDISGSRTPFTITAGARSHSIFVDSQGDVGFGTSTPVVELHTVSGDTPTLRLEQNGSSGFAPQTWDLAGNETSFFLRDATNGSTLPFRVRPGASSNQIVIDTDDEIGIGRLTSDAKVDILGVDAGTSALSVDFENSSTNVTWFFQNDQDETFKISREGSGGAELVLRARQDPGGSPTLTVDGSVQATNVVFASSREKKTAFRTLDSAEILAKLAQIPIQEWRFKTEADTVRHVGPIAEDFAAAFGLGQSQRHINVTDINGVALAAIQGLLDRVESLESRNAELEALVRSLAETP